MYLYWFNVLHKRILYYVDLILRFFCVLLISLSPSKIYRTYRIQTRPAARGRNIYLKSVSDQAVLLPKWFPNLRIILSKYQLGHSFTFWTMPILMFSPVQIIMGHRLCSLRKRDFYNESRQASLHGEKSFLKEYFYIHALVIARDMSFF